MDQSAQYCGFCGKDRAEVRHLVAGPNVFICNECIELCHHIVEGEGKLVEDKPITLLVRAPRSVLEAWCRELVNQPRSPQGDKPLWTIMPIQGRIRASGSDEIAAWKVVIPASFGDLFRLSWPQAREGILQSEC